MRTIRTIRLLRKVGQTTTEYVLVVSVISIAALFALAYFGDPQSPPQQGVRKLSDNFEKGLVNGDQSTMRVQ